MKTYINIEQTANGKEGPVEFLKIYGITIVLAFAISFVYNLNTGEKDADFTDQPKVEVEEAATAEPMASSEKRLPFIKPNFFFDNIFF
ncbi:MAG TPA: hypothetical protein ENJ95_19990 [Bacteroidetes bacterium]|nr:hypothetical protein [Bacteroidota bacterium]